MRKYLIVLILLLFVSACHPIPSEENCSSEGMDATNNASSAHKSTPSSENQFNTEKDSQTAVYFLGNYIYLPSIVYSQHTIDQTNITQFFNIVSKKTDASYIVSPTKLHMASWETKAGDSTLADVYIDQSEFPSFTVQLSPLSPQNLYGYLQWVSDTKLSIGAGTAFFDIEKQSYYEVPLPQSPQLYGIHIYRKYTLEMLATNPSASKAAYVYYADDHVALSVFDFITKRWTIIHRAIPSIYDPYTATWIDDNQLLFTTYQLMIEDMSPEGKCNLLNRLAKDGLAEKDMPSEHLLYTYNVVDQNKLLQGKLEGLQAIEAQNGQILFNSGSEVIVYNGYTDKLICCFSQEGSPLVVTKDYVILDTPTGVTVTNWENQYKLIINIPHTDYYVHQNNFFCKQDNNWYIYVP